METMKKMAQVVDDQNKGDPNYENMAPDYSGYAFKAACDLVLEGRNQQVAIPNRSYILKD